jgi:NADP-dependent 3-hydroxy acid dehydrogenase YdfG
MTESDLSGRIAVVTGASSGIGEAVVHQLVSRGVRVIASARREQRLQELERLFNKDSIRVKAVAGDASQQAVIDSLLDAAPAAFGAEADIVVVNAGRGLAGSVLSSDPEEWEELIRINVLGCLRLMRSSGERLTRNAENTRWPEKPQDMIILGSNVGRHISPFSSVYGSTKFAVNSLAEALRREIGPKGVRVTLIEPGIVETEFQSVAGYDSQWFIDFAERIGPVLKPEHIAQLACFIIGQPAYIHINDIVIRPTRQDYP